MAAMVLLFACLLVWTELLTTTEIIVSAPTKSTESVFHRTRINIGSVSDDKMVSQVIMVPHLPKGIFFAHVMLQFTNRNRIGRKNFIMDSKIQFPFRFDFKKKRYFCTHNQFLNKFHMKKSITLLTIVTIVLVASFAFAGTKPSRKLSGHKNNFLSAPSEGLYQMQNSAAKKDEGGAGAFGEGKMAISVGYGFSGGLARTLLRTYEDEVGYSFSSFGPVHFRGEYGLSDNVGLVLSINHNSWKATWTHMNSNTTTIYQDEFKHSVTSILARINIHFGVTERLDPYWGIGAGYRIPVNDFTSTDIGYDTSFNSPFKVGFETTLGTRYYFTEGFGIYGELGLCQSIIQGGLVVSF